MTVSCQCGHDIHKVQRICLVCNCREDIVVADFDVLAEEIDSLSKELEHRSRLAAITAEQMQEILRRGIPASDELAKQMKRVFEPRLLARR